MYTGCKIVHGSKGAGLTSYCYFLDVLKAYDTVRKKGLWEKLRENGIRGKDVEHNEKDDGVSEKCYDAGPGNMEVCFYILQGVAQGCTLSLNIPKVCINGLMIAVEEAKQGVTKLSENIQNSVGN